MTEFKDQLALLESLDEEIKLLKEEIEKLKPKPRAKKTDEKVLCPICGKELKNKYTLKAHLKLHEDKEQLKCECPICHKFYCSKYYLNKHLKEKHPEYKPEEEGKINDLHEEQAVNSASRYSDGHSNDQKSNEVDKLEFDQEVKDILNQEHK